MNTTENLEKLRGLHSALMAASAETPEAAPVTTPVEPSETAAVAPERTPKGPGVDSRGDPFIERCWDRTIHPEWHEEGRHAVNLKCDIADMMSRPELLTESDLKFLSYVRERRVRSHKVKLTDTQVRILTGLMRRYTDPWNASRFLQQAQRIALRS